MANKLNPKQKRFAEEYLKDLNAKQAAIRAGYSERSAEVQGARLLSNDKVQDFLREQGHAISERTNVTIDRVVQELARLGFSDLRDAFTADGHLIDPKEWPDDLAASIASVEVVTRPTNETAKDGSKIIEHIHKIKVWDKNSALEKLAKHLGMFIERHEHSGKDGEPIQVEWTVVDPKNSAADS